MIKMYFYVPSDDTTLSMDVSRALGGCVETLVRYRCVERDMKVSKCRAWQAMFDLLYAEGLDSEQVNYSGSWYEGMPHSVCGDRDEMVTRKEYPKIVIQHPASRAQDQGAHKLDRAGYVLAEENPDQPAYLRLLVPHGMSFESEDITNSVIQHNDSSYLSSSIFVTHTLGEGAEVHGPASAKVLFNRNPKWGMVDRVHCLSYPAWPPCAQEFFSRSRAHNWPPQRLLQHIEQAGCLVVGIGHQSTDRRHLEWRLSFSVAEKEVIHNMNSAMAGTMATLKALKKYQWPGDTTVGVCSYYFKVACLWYAELNEPTDDIMATVRNVLDWLVQCYQENNLPHYFIAKQNLIGHLPPTTCKEMASQLGEMKSELRLHVLCSFKIREIIRPMQLGLGDKASQEEYKQALIKVLRGDEDKAVRVLEQATHIVCSGSEWFVQAEHHWSGIWSSVNYPAIYNTLSECISTKPAVEVAAIPERIVLLLIDSLPSFLLNKTHEGLFQSALYRLLGDLYHSLFAHFKQQKEDLLGGVLESCHQKSDKYYTEGLNLLYPDGWTDRGLSGYVNLAKFYHLTEKWDKVESVMAQLWPLLEEAGQTPEVPNSLPRLVVDTRYDLCKLPWRGDKHLFWPLIERPNDTLVYINPAVLGFYIQGRLSLRAENKPFVRRCLGLMQQTSEGMLDGVQRTSTQVFIEVLNTRLNDPEHDDVPDVLEARTRSCCKSQCCTLI